MLANGVSREDARASHCLEPPQLFYLLDYLAASLCRSKHGGVRSAPGRLVLDRVTLSQRSISLEGAKGICVRLNSHLHLQWYSIQGVENVYTQHTPHLTQTLENIFKGRLRDTSYPFIDGAGPNASLQRSAFRISLPSQSTHLGLIF